MANELMIPGGDNKMVLPDHIARRFKPEDSNILTGDRIPTVGIRGKVFSISADGETTQITTRDNEGNEYPAPSLSVVVIDYAAKMGRSYYQGKFDPNNIQPPTCWSEDCVTPHADVPEEIKTTITSHKCASCPMSVKGSALTDSGGTAAACSQHRILALVPYKRMDMDPLRLRIAQTSNYDGRSPEHKKKGLLAFQNFLDSLKSRGIPHTRSIVTRMTFDPDQAYPKLLFTPVKFLDDDEIDRIDAIVASGKVEEILGDHAASAFKASGGKALPAPTQAKALPAPVKVVEPPQTATEVVEPEDEEAALQAQLAAARANKAAKAKAEAEAAAQAEAEAKAKAQPTEPEDEEAALERMLAEARAKKAAAQSAGTTEALKASVAATEPKAEAPANGNGTKRTRRTKEQIAADEAKAAAAAKVGDEKFLPKALDGNMGDEDEGTQFAEPSAPVKNGNGGAAAVAPKAQPIQATPVPADVAKLLTNWDD